LFKKCPHDHRLTNKTYLSVITLTNISPGFTHKMAVKISWHSYGTKLHHCHPMYSLTKADRTTMPDTTKLSCLCRVHFGGVNWIPDNSRLSPSENLRSRSEHVNSNYPIHTATPFVILMTNTWRIKRCIIITTQTGLFGRVWCGGVN